MTKLMDNKYVKMIIVTLLCIVVLISNILNCDYSNNNIFISIVVLTMTNILTLASYVLILKKPILSLLSIIFAQGLSLLYSKLKGENIGDTAEQTIVYLIIAIIVLIINIRIIIKHSKDKIKPKEIITYERNIIKLPIYVIFITLCLGFTAVMAMANSNTFGEYADPNFKVLASMILVLPTLALLSILTTSNISVIFLVINYILKIYTIYKLYITHSLDVGSFIYELVELVIVIYITYNYIKIARMNKYEKQIK